VVLATPLIEAWGMSVLHGHEGVENWIRRMEGQFAFLYAEPLAVEQMDDWVRGHCRVRGRGKASSGEIEFELHHAVRFEGSLIAEFHAALTPEDAAAKAGGR
jgi:SnoaL-like domain